MRPSQFSFYLLTAILLVIIIFLPSVGWRVHAWLLPPAPAVNSGTNLIAQNQALEAQVAQYATMANALPVVPSSYVPAMVFSRYPENFRSELFLDVGSDEHIATGSAVVIEPATSSYILIGTVKNVFAHTALVETVFDPDFKMPVRIGTKGSDGLFVGGANPSVMSIQKSAVINPGDIVITADSAIPYGLPVAQVVSTSISPDSLFKQASLSFSYNIGSIQAVLVQR